MQDQTLTPEPLLHHIPRERGSQLDALLVLWSRDEPDRVGELVLIPPGPAQQVWFFGRNSATPLPHDHLGLFRQRPGSLEGTGGLLAPRVSRQQLRLQRTTSGVLEVENLGRCPMRHQGLEAKHATLREGETLELVDQLLLLHVRRPLQLPPLPPELQVALQPFGEADDVGIVGEGPAVWEMRRQLAFVARRQTHVLILGPSGTGKELAARALHLRSSRSKLPMVSRNAATIPETLIDAELFGNARNYPNAGMPERPGLVGEADATTLFLDEIGELPIALQSHLLRVLDQGEYQRLGETTRRTSSLRLVAATNRPETDLKHDLLARLQSRLTLPDLNTRREDIPLITRHLLRRIAAGDPDIARRFFPGGDPNGSPNLTPALMRALVQHTYTTHVRELQALLWQSMSGSPGSWLELHEGVRFQAEESGSMDEGEEVDPIDLSPEIVQAALDRHQGVQEKVCRELGLKSRFVLYRLIKKYGLVSPRKS